MRKLFFVLAFLAAAAVVRADEITLRSGQVIKGRITKQTSAMVTIDAVINGMRATVTYPRNQIRSITLAEVPDSFFEPAAPEPATADPGQPADPLDIEDPADDPLPDEINEPFDEGEGETIAPEAFRYMTIPLKGGVGAEITARGVRDALKLAQRRRLNAVVFVIDTDGGRVADAEAIVRVMDAERANLQIYAIVVKAMSAGIWPLSRADRIFFAPGGAAGAAVAYSQATSSGNVQVDAKFNAALAAEIAAAAERKGQPGSIYRAMMEAEARLFRWRDAQGALKLAGEPPPSGAQDVSEIVTQGQVLALTSRQAAELGFALELPSNDPGAIGELLSIPGWQTVGDAGAAPMRAAHRQIERCEKEIENARRRLIDAREQVVERASQIVSLRTAAINADPGRITVYYRENTGMLTPESQARWREQTDIAVRRWNDFLAGISAVEAAQRRADRALDDLNRNIAREFEARMYTEEPEIIELDPVEHGLDLATLQREASAKRADLLARRSITRIGQ